MAGTHPGVVAVTQQSQRSGRNADRVQYLGQHDGVLPAGQTLTGLRPVQDLMSIAVPNMVGAAVSPSAAHPRQHLQRGFLGLRLGSGNPPRQRGLGARIKAIQEHGQDRDRSGPIGQLDRRNRLVGLHPGLHYRPVSFRGEGVGENLRVRAEVVETRIDHRDKKLPSIGSIFVVCRHSTRGSPHRHPVFGIALQPRLQRQQVRPPVRANMVDRTHAHIGIHFRRSCRHGAPLSSGLCRPDNVTRTGNPPADSKWHRLHIAADSAHWCFRRPDRGFGVQTNGSAVGTRWVAQNARGLCRCTSTVAVSCGWRPTIWR
jgi:hypothetical protein